MQRSWICIALAPCLVAACGLVDSIGSLDGEFDATADARSDAADASALDASVDASDASDAADAIAADAPSDAPFDCAPPLGKNPCAGVSSGSSGCYCGTSTQSGFDRDAAVAACLYDCQSGAIKSTVYCPDGCIVNEVDAADKCVGGGGC